MKNPVIIYLLVASLFTPSWCQKRISILGDSYSAYKGYVSPVTNAIWYTDSMRHKNDVRRVEYMWWWILMEELHATIDINNSYSGSTICNTGYYHKDYSDRSFIARMKNIGQPDLLIIFGGTNDCWVRAPLGKYIHNKWTDTDLFKFRPALCYMFDYLKSNHPKVRILFVCNSDLTKPYTQSIKAACQLYKVELLELHNIDKQDGHPSILGMQQIAQQIITCLKNRFYPLSEETEGNWGLSDLLPKTRKMMQKESTKGSVLCAIVCCIEAAKVNL